MLPKSCCPSEYMQAIVSFFLSRCMHRCPALGTFAQGLGRGEREREFDCEGATRRDSSGLAGWTDKRRRAYPSATWPLALFRDVVWPHQAMDRRAAWGASRPAVVWWSCVHCCGAAGVRTGRAASSGVPQPPQPHRVTVTLERPCRRSFASGQVGDFPDGLAQVCARRPCTEPRGGACAPAPRPRESRPPPRHTEVKVAVGVREHCARPIPGYSARRPPHRAALASGARAVHLRGSGAAASPQRRTSRAQAAGGVRAFGRRPAARSFSQFLAGEGAYLEGGCRMRRRLGLARRAACRHHSGSTPPAVATAVGGTPAVAAGGRGGATSLRWRLDGAPWPRAPAAPRPSERTRAVPERRASGAAWCSVIGYSLLLAWVGSNKGS